MNYLKYYLATKTIEFLARIGEILGYRIHRNLTRREIEQSHREADLDFKRRSSHEPLQNNQESP